jgi:hypothetical protein
MAIDGGEGFLASKCDASSITTLLHALIARRRHVRPRLAIILGDVDVAVVGADPQQRRLHRRWRDREDDAEALRLLRHVGRRGRVEVRRDAGILARHVSLMRVQ